MKSLFLWLFLILVQFTFAMAILPHPPAFADQLNDKTMHMLAFATLSIAASSAFRQRPMIQLFVGLAAFGGLIEIVQAILGLHRDAEFADWLADCGATLAGLCAVKLLEAVYARYKSQDGTPPG